LNADSVVVAGLVIIVIFVILIIGRA